MGHRKRPDHHPLLADPRAITDLPWLAPSVAVGPGRRAVVVPPEPIDPEALYARPGLFPLLEAAEVGCALPWVYARRHRLCGQNGNLGRPLHAPLPTDPGYRKFGWVAPGWAFMLLGEVEEYPTARRVPILRGLAANVTLRHAALAALRIDGRHGLAQITRQIPTRGAP